MDHLFKEKLKDFSKTPDERVWENIEASLNKKKKRRVIPLWWPLGGAAAAIALLLLLFNPFSNENDSGIIQTVVESEKNNTPSTPNSKTDVPSGISIGVDSQDIEVVDAETRPGNPIEASTGSSLPENDKTTVSQNSGDFVAGVASSNSNREDLTKPRAVDTKNYKNPSILDNQTEVAQEQNLTSGTKESFQENDPNGRNVAVTKETEVAQNNEDNEKKSIYDAIEEQKQLEIDAIAENTLNNRWSMGPSVAPVFFSALGEGSPIHSNFASNSKSGKLNLSYGLTVSYQVSEKLSIRSGVHKVDFGYDTNDIVFTSSLTTSTNELISNINYAQTSRNLVVESKNTSDAALSDNAEITGELSPFEGRMVQQLGYVEVPMEVNYALLDRKFGVNLIGGVSSLFLVDNAVSLESDELITEMGEANNANTVNFSTNIGVGFNYEISQKLQLNVEPMFKYQLNTFSESAGNFRPYSVGVYSGLSFKF